MPDRSLIRAQNDPPAGGPVSATALIGFEVTAAGPALLVSMSGATITVDLDLADDEVAVGGPDAGGTRRLGMWVHAPGPNLHRAVQAPGTPQPVRSVATVNFTLGLATDVVEEENLTGLNGNAGRIRSITIVSKENLAWEVAFYDSDAFTHANPDSDHFIDSHRFAEGDGLQEGGTGLFRYAVSGLDIPYVDTNSTNELHVSLINRSAAAKTAGVPGEVVVRTTIEESA